MIHFYLLLMVMSSQMCKPDTSSETTWQPNVSCTYERILDTYLKEEICGEGVDLFKLWRDLGLNIKAVQVSEGHYLFDAKEGEKQSCMTAHTSTLGRTKVISLSRTYGSSQILVFRQVGKGAFYFAYAFVHDAGYHCGVTLHEPKPGMLLAELNYQNRHGSGVFGTGWALFLIGERGAKLLLMTDTYAHEAAWSGLYFQGHRCEIKPVQETWPFLNLAFFAELLLPLENNPNPSENDDIIRWQLETNVTLKWNPRKNALIPVDHPALSQEDILALVDDQALFMQKRIEDETFLSNPKCVLIKKIVKKAEWTSYPWGK